LYGDQATPGASTALCNVALYDCLVQGGSGLSGSGKSPAHSGANGLTANDSIVMASNCQFVGGSGGFGASPPFPCAGGFGGDAIRFDGSGSMPAICYLRDGSEQGGMGGSGCGGPAPSGLPLNIHGALVQVFPSAHRELVAPCPVRESTAIALVFRGVPGDRVALVYSTSTRFGLSTPFEGVFLCGTEARSARMGTIPIGGTLNVTLPVPALDPGVEACLRSIQAVFVDGTGLVTLGSPATLVILDSAY
jgi:hypothetical protein